MIYFDNAATTEILPEVLEAMDPYLKKEYANPGAIYSSGSRAKRGIEHAREQVAEFIGCDFDQVIFTSCGSEGNSFVIGGLRPYLNICGKNHIVTSKTEHDSVLYSIRRMSLVDGFDHTEVNVCRDGVIDIDELKKSIREDTGLASVMHVNNELGSENPIDEISEICHRNGVLFHTDCVQSAGMIPLDMKNIGCDFATISSHKIHGPKGAGAVFVKKKNYISPIISGGKYQEFGYRGGTENVPAIIGFGEACEIAHNNIVENIKKYKELSDVFVKDISSVLPYVKFNGETGKIIGNKILSVTIPGIDAQSLILMLCNEVELSAGSACCSHDNVPSHVLKAIGLSDYEARSTIRISFSSINTIDDVKSSVALIKDSVDKLKSIK